MENPVTFLSVSEVAKLFRVSKMTIYRMCKTGEIESTRVGRSFRIYAHRLTETHPITTEQIASVVDNK